MSENRPNRGGGGAGPPHHQAPRPRQEQHSPNGGGYYRSDPSGGRGRQYSGHRGGYGFNDSRHNYNSNSSSNNYHHGGGGGRQQQLLQEMDAVPTHRITPFIASQPNAAQHGATVVRTGATHTQEANGGRGTVQFYTSVQRKGGAFTDSEAATLRQLGPQRNMQRARRDDKEQNESISLTAAGNLRWHAVAAVQKKFVEAEETRRAKDFEEAKRQESQRKRTRYELDSDSDDEDDGSESD